MSACCPVMEWQLNRECELHPDPWDCADALAVVREMASGSFLVFPVRDGGRSFLLVEFCPWCGTKVAQPFDTQ